MCEISLVRIRYGEVDEGQIEILKRQKGVGFLLEHGDQVGQVV